MSYKYNRGSGGKGSGDQIIEMIEEAINSMDFSGLNRKIRETITLTGEEINRQMKARQQQPPKKPVVKNVKRPLPNPYQRKLPGTYSGPAQIAAGGTGLAVFGGLAAGIGIMAASMPASAALSAAVIILESLFIPLGAISGFFLSRGILTSNRLNRIKDYMRHWKGRSYIMLSELEEKVRTKPGLLRKDIRYLLDKNLLPGAKIDPQETCLMLDETAIAQYEAARESARIREEEERRKAEEEDRLADAPQSEREMHAFITRAEETLKEIDHYQAAFHDREMLGRLDRLELILSRIFICVKEHPDKIRKADRLMNYYLPSVMKLLSVYEDLDRQPIQGDNIAKTKSEIEASLDTMNDALEKMFDELFQDEALDVSADIQVLRTMLAREGWVEPSLHLSPSEES